MKLNKFTYLAALGLVLTLAASGCRKRPEGITPLPAGKTQAASDMPDTGKPLTGDNTSGNEVNSQALKEGLTSNNPDAHKDWIHDAEMFKADTVHFDFDSANVKASDKDKVQHVADYLKNNSAVAVEVDGHCDERGTEEYNRALGDRRALSVREELVRLGIDKSRVDTVSFGEDKPAAQGHDEAAWRQNRRGEFILLTPPGTKVSNAQ